MVKSVFNIGIPGVPLPRNKIVSGSGMSMSIGAFVDKARNEGREIVYDVTGEYTEESEVIDFEGSDKDPS